MSGRRGSHEGSQIYEGWVAQLAEQWTENLVFTLRDTFAPSYGWEHARTVMITNDRDTVNTVSTAQCLDLVLRAFVVLLRGLLHLSPSNNEMIEREWGHTVDAPCSHSPACPHGDWFQATSGTPEFTTIERLRVCKLNGRRYYAREEVGGRRVT